jgi:hypothetical protein
LAILASELFGCEALLTIRRPVLESGTPIGVRIAIKIFFYRSAISSQTCLAIGESGDRIDGLKGSEWCEEPVTSAAAKPRH